MIKKIQRLIPPGISVKAEVSGIGVAILLAAIHSLFYFNNFYSAYNNLFEYYTGKKVLVTSRKMTDFWVVVDNCFDGFYIVIFLLFALCIFHYVYHYRESKSIYTMKRLPKRIELYKRCVTVPFICIVLCYVISGLLTILYFNHYMITTPPECLTDGQWEMLLRVKLP